MNAVQIHLALNHLPVFGSLVAVLLLAYALLVGKEEVRKAALALLVLLGLTSPVVYFSGERSEDRVEEMRVSHDAIEEHEEAAKWAFPLLLIQGILAAAALALSLLPDSRRPRIRASWAALLFSLLAFVSSAWTAHTGGLIRHSEELGGQAPGSSADH
ncbi:MAG TPA: hypothetical protein VK465_12870 [Fibrobacteria bacterium]|nr:hypothetical protein [Fibrobacteria bacterium]